MNERREKKTDRRTLYTRMVIKDALLSLLTEKEYADITVADLCREAEINRGTFYLHYDNIRQVMDELFDDALSRTHGVLTQLGCAERAEQRCSYPLCRFLRENRKYQPLFFSESLQSRAIERIAAGSREAFLEQMHEQTGLSDEVLTAILYLQISGCLAISRRSTDIPDGQWEQIRCEVDRFLKAGVEELKKK